MATSYVQLLSQIFCRCFKWIVFYHHGSAVGVPLIAFDSTESIYDVDDYVFIQTMQIFSNRNDMQ